MEPSNKYEDKLKIMLDVSGVTLGKARDEEKKHKLHAAYKDIHKHIKKYLK